MVYPFLPTIARGLGVEIESVTLAITARSSLGLAGPIFGLTADRLGRKTAMLLGLGIYALGLLLVALFPTFTTLTLGLLLGAAGKLVFDPAMQAYLGDHVQYDRRGIAIATTEFGWSGASLLGLPLVGWIIARAGWVAPFPLLIILTVIFGSVIWRTLPRDRIAQGDKPTLLHALRRIASHPTALASLGVSMMISASNETLNIIYGVWLEEAFALRVVAIGTATALIGFAELSGEGIVATLTDRFGKNRSVRIGILLSGISCLTLTPLGASLPGALWGLFFLFICFEFTFVSLISMMTEVLPDARGTLMAANLAASAGGRAFGAIIGPKLFSLSILANGLVAALLAWIALLVFISFVTIE
jgi:predicted MFS family arabinose efflux permease